LVDTIRDQEPLFAANQKSTDSNVAFELLGLGVTILVGGELSLMRDIREAVTVVLVWASDEVAQEWLVRKHSGVFTASLQNGLNTSITIKPTKGKGLGVHSFISNGTDIFTAWELLVCNQTHGKPWRAHLIPALLYRDEKHQRGERWQIIVGLEDGKPDATWDDFWITDNDSLLYIAKLVSEVVVWDNKEGSRATEVEMMGFRIKMGRNVTVSTGSSHWIDSQFPKSVLVQQYVKAKKYLEGQ